MKKYRIIAIVLAAVMALTPLGAAAEKVVFTDVFPLIGVWTGEGSITGNVTEQIPGDNGTLVSRKSLKSVNLPDGAYSVGDSEDLILTLNEEYLKTQTEGQHTVELEFEETEITALFFVVTEKQPVGEPYRLCANANGSSGVMLVGLPQSLAVLCEDVKVDGSDADSERVTVSWSLGTIAVTVSAGFVKDGKPREITLKFTNLEDVTIKLFPNESRGDADSNGKVDAKDARLALRASAKLTTLPDAGFASANLNGDREISSAEARRILRYSAKLESSLEM